MGERPAAAGGCGDSGAVAFCAWRVSAFSFSVSNTSDRHRTALSPSPKLVALPIKSMVRPYKSARPMPAGPINCAAIFVAQHGNQHVQHLHAAEQTGGFEYLSVIGHGVLVTSFCLDVFEIEPEGLSGRKTVG